MQLTAIEAGTSADTEAKTEEDDGAGAGIEAIYGASAEAGDGLDCSLTGQIADDSESLN